MVAVEIYNSDKPCEVISDGKPQMFGHCLESICDDLQDCNQYADYTLTYDDLKPGFEIYCDASFADHPDRKSSQGFLVIMNGAAIEWSATKQKTVTTSTTKAELLALSAIAGHSYWWRRLFESMDLKLKDEAFQVLAVRH